MTRKNFKERIGHPGPMCDSNRVSDSQCLRRSKDLKSYDHRYEERRKIMWFGQIKDLDLLMFLKEKSRKINGWAEVKIRILTGNKQKK